MSLILAVEPDRRQAAQLTGIIRHYVGAELILAETTERALGAIGRRVPDLVLVPALLAPQDDAALASALRVIAAAAHVRTLTIPVFANGVSHKKRSGMLARLGLGRKVNKVPDGCEPSVFAEQVMAYLREAAADRAATEPAVEPVAAPAAVHAELESAEIEPVHTALPSREPVPEAPEPIAYETPEPIVYEAPEPIVYVAPEPIAYEAPESMVYETPEPIVCQAADISTHETADPAGHQTDDPIAVAAPAPNAFEYPQLNAYDAVEQSVPESATPPAQEEILAAESGDEEITAPAAVEQEAETAAVPVLEEEEDQGIDLSDELFSLCEEDDGESETEEVEVYSIDVTPEELLADGTDEELEAFIDTPVLAALSEPESIVAAPTIEARAEAETPAEGFEPDAIAELQAALDEPLPVVADQAWDEPTQIEEDPSADSGVELWMPLPLVLRWPALHGMVSEPRPVFIEGFNENDFVREPHVIAAAAPSEPAAPRPTPARSAAPLPTATSSEAAAKSSEWVELIESLRLDIERLKTTPSAEKPRAAAAPKREPAAKPAKRVSKRAQPIQDEWGFFDPEQCGFAALLAKLDEITESPDEPGPRSH